jgi:hypothetical protein
MRAPAPSPFNSQYPLPGCGTNSRYYPDIPSYCAAFPQDACCTSLGQSRLTPRPPSEPETRSCDFRTVDYCSTHPTDKCCTTSLPGCNPQSAMYPNLAVYCNSFPQDACCLPAKKEIDWAWLTPVLIVLVIIGLLGAVVYNLRKPPADALIINTT